ncbi:hypothetical protein VNO77_35933 [Canavalia gladiata]|uniref:Anamorsin homolog n=1 Tax=Canavalia gladiata TaxID=3824 RepID=A0AAN9K7C9_CANGL
MRGIAERVLIRNQRALLFTEAASSTKLCPSIRPPPPLPLDFETLWPGACLSPPKSAINKIVAVCYANTGCFGPVSDILKLNVCIDILDTCQPETNLSQQVSLTLKALIIGYRVLLEPEDLIIMDGAKTHGAVLACTDGAVLPFSQVFDAIREVGNEGVGQWDPLALTSASLLSKLPVESSSVDFVILIWLSNDCPMDQLIQEILRVLKVGGTILIRKSSQSAVGSVDKMISDLTNKLLLAGFSDTQVLQSTGIKAKKPSWKIGSSFALKVVNSSPKIQIDVDSDLIDEDSLLTEEDLKKPQLPTVGDCEVGSTRKACKNCTCGRAQEEEKVLKLGLTTEQINNPQSACGNCGLGDAFRCGSCPYKGLPPFKLGEKVALSGNFLAADI